MPGLISRTFMCSSCTAILRKVTVHGAWSSISCHTMQPPCPSCHISGYIARRHRRARHLRTSIDSSALARAVWASQQHAPGAVRSFAGLGVDKFAVLAVCFPAAACTRFCPAQERALHLKASECAHVYQVEAWHTSSIRQTDCARGDCNVNNCSCKIPGMGRTLLGQSFLPVLGSTIVAAVC